MRSVSVRSVGARKCVMDKGEDFLIIGIPNAVICVCVCVCVCVCLRIRAL